MVTTYKPPSFSKEYYFALVNKALDACSSKFENIILMGDFNTTPSEVLVEFLENRELCLFVLYFPLALWAKRTQAQ